MAKPLGFRSGDSLVCGTGAQTLRPADRGSRGHLPALAVDEAVAAIVGELKRAGELGETYVDYKDGHRELYDLKRDPAQMNSLAGDPRRRGRLRTLRRILGDLTRCAGRECREGAAATAR